MKITKATAVAMFVLSFNSILGDSLHNSVFTKEIKLNEGRHPFKVKNELRLLKYETIVSAEFGQEYCKLYPFTSNLLSDYTSISTLGNGKLLFAQTVDKYDVIDANNCSSYLSTGTFAKRKGSDMNRSLGFVVTYNDTFDIFDYYQRTCKPCRYNDKGERLPVEHLLERELTGEDPISAYQHDIYSLEFVKGALGNENGYFYVFGYVNGTTALRILDSKFKIVKQRLFNGTVEAYSSTNGNITVCRMSEVYFCPSPTPAERLNCAHVECHLLDADLNSAAIVKLHEATDPKKFVDVQMKVQNLIGGGAMVAMQFDFQRDFDNPIHHKELFIQRIHPNGRVDPPILFDSLDNDSVLMHDFVLDNGEYCLVTVNSYVLEHGKNYNTLIKCLIPSADDYSVV